MSERNFEKLSTGKKTVIFWVSKVYLTGNQKPAHVQKQTPSYMEGGTPFPSFRALIFHQYFSKECLSAQGMWLFEHSSRSGQKWTTKWTVVQRCLSKRFTNPMLDPEAARFLSIFSFYRIIE